MTRSSSRRRQRLWPSLLFTLLGMTSASQGVSRRLPFPRTVSPRTETPIPLIITNNCKDDIWPAIATQAGTGPDTGGFQLKSGTSKELKVGADWQGRVWGRTNCSFNSDGSGPSNLNGNNGAGQACGTGDCNGKMNCVVTGDTPVTLCEFDLAGGSNEDQTFYDISLVDGYNLAVGIQFLPGNNSKLQEIPPNLTNAACIGTTGQISAPTSTNSTYPIPYDTTTTNADLATWCPWDLQLNPPTKPGDGVYPYPDDDIKRPVFCPCLSACAKTNSAQDCCTGSYNDPSVCKPSIYSSQAKAICPDAYSFAFDDQTSTFIIPTGGGWQVTFCPGGRSTNILNTFGAQLHQLATIGEVTAQVLSDAQNVSLIQNGAGVTAMTVREKKVGSLGALVIMLAWACLW